MGVICAILGVFFSTVIILYNKQAFILVSLNKDFPLLSYSSLLVYLLRQRHEIDL